MVPDSSRFTDHFADGHDRDALPETPPAARARPTTATASERGGHDDRRLAILCDVTRRLAKAQDTDAIFERIVNEAVHVLDADAAGLRLREGEDLVLRARTAGADALMSRPRLKVGESLSGRAVATAQPVLVEDLASDLRHDPSHKRAAIELGFRSAAVLPLEAHGHVVGTLAVFSKRRRQLHDDDIALLRAFADQAAVAIETERRAARLAALAHVNQAISASLDLSHVLATIARATGELMGVPLVRFWIANEQAQRLDLRASSSGLDGSFPLPHIPFGEGCIGWVAQHRRALDVPDVRAEPRTLAADWFAAHGFTSLFASPMLLDGMLIGVLVLIGRGPIVLEPDDRELLQSVLAQAAVAVRNAALYEDLRVAHMRLEQRTHDLDVLNRMGGMLQACGTADDVYAVLSTFMDSLFADASGAVFVTSPSRDVLEPHAEFGSRAQDEWRPFSPDACWAVRRGRVHVVDGVTMALRCRHYGTAPAESTLCVPLMAHGESLGLLTFRRVRASGPMAWDEEHQRLAQTVADQLGLALANLRLRETLRNQSIRDPLTGLFNRRYMEETLERELKRAARAKSELSVIMLDLDHFKRFNDAFGHATGDAMLRDFGGMVRTSVREADVACRYGGEEFVLILPDTPAAVAAQRINDLRERMRQLHPTRSGDRTMAATFSAGLAAFPQCGADVDSLLRVADAALYEAKGSGRDRVVVAPALR